MTNNPKIPKESIQETVDFLKYICTKEVDEDDKLVNHVLSFIPFLEFWIERAEKCTDPEDFFDNYYKRK